MIFPLIILSIGAIAAGLLNWPKEQLAEFLGKSPSFALSYEVARNIAEPQPALFGQPAPQALKLIKFIGEARGGQRRLGPAKNAALPGRLAGRPAVARRTGEQFTDLPVPARLERLAAGAEVEAHAIGAFLVEDHEVVDVILHGRRDPFHQRDAVPD